MLWFVTKYKQKYSQKTSDNWENLTISEVFAMIEAVIYLTFL